MADFKQSILKTLLNEGGFVNDPCDPGGATNCGITQKDMPDQDIKTLTQDQAISYYQENYWKKHYTEIQNQLIADKLFDTGVLFGVGEAVKLLQTVLGMEKADGVFGPATLIDTNGADPATLLQGYKTLLVSYAIGLTAENMSLKKFITGWIRRINS